MHDLTGFQRDCLYVVTGLAGAKGLAVKSALDEYYGTEINHGRLYPNLDALVEKGLVEKGQIDDRTNSYSLTDRGRREIEARREWEDQYVDTIID
jgi:DNA-binding PadR family transcriptional regulator